MSWELFVLLGAFCYLGIVGSVMVIFRGNWRGKIVGSALLVASTAAFTLFCLILETA